MNFTSISSFLSAMHARILNRIQLRNILRNIAWLSFDKIVRLGINVIVGIWIARYLGPEQFGLLSYAIAFVGLLAPLATFGIESIIVRDVLNESEKQKNTTLGSAFFLKLLGGVLTVIIAYIAIIVVRTGDQTSLILVLILSAAAIFQSFDVIDYWFQSLLKAKYVVIARNFAFIITSVVKIFLIIYKAPLVTFAIISLIEIVFASLGLAVVYYRNGYRMNVWHVQFKRIRSFLADGWPLVFSSIAVVIYMKIGQVMIGDMLDNTAAGIYSVAVRLAEVWYFIPTAISASVFPSIIKAQKENAAKYKERLQTYYDLMSGLSIAIAVIMTFVGDTLVVLLFGQQYGEAGPVLSIYIWASVPVFLGVASNQYLLAENLTKISLYRTAIGGIASVLLNLLLISYYGIIGAAWAVLISYMIATFSIVIFRNTREQSLMLLASLNPIRALRIVIKTAKTQ
ncbi:MAG: flippase [Bacteroidota bacterium]|nr:flippase [Bacteroidota bacterium]